MSRYSSIYRQSPFERYEFIARGVPVDMLMTVARDMGITEKEVRELLQLSSAALNKRFHSPCQLLYGDAASRVVSLFKLIGQVEEMVAESGNADNFVAARWMGTWLHTPNPALGGKLPAEFLHLSEGQGLLASLLRQMQSGAYG